MRLLPSGHAAVVLRRPYTPGGWLRFGCFAAWFEHGATSAQLRSLSPFGCVLGQPEMMTGAVAAVGAFASRCHVEQGAGELVGGDSSGGHGSDSSTGVAPRKSRKS